MKRNSSLVKKYLSERNENLETRKKLRNILNECCCDDLTSNDKVEILKEIFMLLTELVFGDQPTKIEISQGYLEENDRKK